MPSPPKPGHPVRGSTTGRPLMAALDLFGRRWTLRVLWELRDDPLGFRALQQQCDGMSSSVLRQRLVELQDAQLVERGGQESYRLTKLGREAYEELLGLHSWAERWAAELETGRSTDQER
ncbi:MULTISPECIES: winged helix-turn-helix transcriptional regulator [unclassified Streptomyces]|uniref:winged helix-turn-helix transcriptional regulator n=1 Tax=unclassified Streptomyces TaxID=2593676 RepID=UPI00224D6CFD|nr:MULTISPECIES: helix-turn-helix domain-containing protein [unclassified Streptomyces]MCX4834129.1 helix-turn-helix transcriptional regulator [Streptomyces sp. NBC_01016]